MDESTIVIRFNKDEIRVATVALTCLKDYLSAYANEPANKLNIERIRLRLDLAASLLREHEPAQAGPYALELVGVAPLNVPAKPLYRWACSCGNVGTWRENRASVVTGMHKHVKAPHFHGATGQPLGDNWEAKIEEQPRRSIAHLSAIDKWS